MSTARLINESPFSVSLRDTTTGVDVLRDVPPFSVSTRSPYEPHAGSNFTVWWGAALETQVAYTATDVSVVVASPDGSDLVAVALADAVAPVPAAWDTIGVCSLRVINAMPGVPVTATGVSDKCAPNCMLPALAVVPPLDGSRVIPFDCSRGFRFGASAGSTQFGAPVQALAAAEHARYTMVVRPPLSGNSSVDFALLLDAPGDANALLPILWAALALAALAIAHRALGAAVSRFGAPLWLASPSGLPGPDSLLPPQGCMQALLGAAVEAAQALARWLFVFFGFDSVRAAPAPVVPAAALPEKDGAAELSVTLLADESPATALAPDEAAARVAPSYANATSGAPADTSTKPGSAGRFASVDALRGLSLCIMIFVNSGGGGYWFFQHIAWNGLTLADVVFPLFLWLQGVSMAISLASARRRGLATGGLAAKVLARAARTWALGLFLNNGRTPATWRLLGVLPYFAFSYAIVGLALLLPEGPANPPAALGAAAARAGPAAAAALASCWKAVCSHWRQWSVMTAIAVVYLSVRAGLPAGPGCPAGYAGPGGLSDQGRFLDRACTGGAARAVDLAVLGAAHMYKSATCQAAMRCASFEPEGVMGIAGAAWLTWLGVQAGRTLLAGRALPLRSTLAKLAGGAVAAGLLGGALAGFAQEGGAYPVNKNLWSPSFVLVISSMGFAGVAAGHWVVDALGAWSGAPFTFAGANSILLYVGSSLLGGYAPFSWRIGPGSHGELLAGNVAGVLAWLVVARVLALKRLFVNL